MDDSQVNHTYDIILGSDILSELKIGLCFSENTIRVNVVIYEGCKDSMKYVLKINSSA